MKIIRSIASIACAFSLYPVAAQAEQYATGTHSFISEQGTLKVNAGRVSPAGATEFVVYSFLFKPKNSSEYYQVPRVDSETETKPSLVLQTRRAATGMVFDAKVSVVNNQLTLITGASANSKSSGEEGLIDLTTYELTRLGEQERWVFLRKSSRKSAAKTSVDKALDEIPKILDK